MKTSSKKAKGRNLQNFIAKELRDLYTQDLSKISGDGKYGKQFADAFQLQDEDIKPAIMGESGTDIKFSPRAKVQIPWDIEAKNQETWSIPAWWRQTLANTEEGRKPLLVVKKNHTTPLVILRWEDFKELL